MISVICKQFVLKKNPKLLDCDIIVTQVLHDVTYISSLFSSHEKPKFMRPLILIPDKVCVMEVP